MPCLTQRQLREVALGWLLTGLERGTVLHILALRPESMGTAENVTMLRHQIERLPRAHGAVIARSHRQRLTIGGQRKQGRSGFAGLFLCAYAVE
jgi:hypothetical protein